MSSAVQYELNPNQPPLGAQFKSYELNKAVNYYTLDPFQYSITKFDYNVPGKSAVSSPGIDQKDFKYDPGLVYRGVDFEKLLPSFTSEKKSVNDFPAQSYHRFLANEGYFNPGESTNNTDLWYYGADSNSRTNGIGAAGAPLNVQEVNHIIFPEPQRGGTNTQQMSKYSWTSSDTKYINDKVSWESENYQPVDNSQNCEFFNYNSGYSNPQQHNNFNQVYSFDSNYLRSINVNPSYRGSMPFNPQNVQ